jgi:hypothetical protein
MMEKILLYHYLISSSLLQYVFIYIIKRYTKLNQFFCMCLFLNQQNHLNIYIFGNKLYEQCPNQTIPKE